MQHPHTAQYPTLAVDVTVYAEVDPDTDERGWLVSTLWRRPDGEVHTFRTYKAATSQRDFDGVTAKEAAADAVRSLTTQMEATR